VRSSSSTRATLQFVIIRAGFGGWGGYTTLTESGKPKDTSLLCPGPRRREHEHRRQGHCISGQGDADRPLHRRRRASSSISISTKSCPLNFGESLAVVSNANAWEPSTAAQLSWSEGDIWQGQVEVDGIETLEFKLVKVGGDGAVIEWEEGENKQVDVKGTKTLECSWGSSELQIAEKKATRKRSAPKKKAAAVVAEEPAVVAEEPAVVVAKSPRWSSKSPRWSPKTRRPPSVWSPRRPSAPGRSCTPSTKATTRRVRRTSPSGCTGSDDDDEAQPKRTNTCCYCCNEFFYYSSCAPVWTLYPCTWRTSEARGAWRE
jgi:hypothetical protein